DVAREEDRRPSRVHADEPGADDVADAVDRELDARDHPRGLVEGNLLQERQGPPGVVFREEGLGWAMPRISLLVRVAGFFFLAPSRVGEQVLEERARRRRAVHRPGVALADEPREIARVVDVRVREEDRLDLSDGRGERLAVLRGEGGAALEHAAVDED